MEFKLNENEITIKTLVPVKDWYVVRHGRKFEWSKSMFRFELLRKIVLTSERIVFLKDSEIDYEIPLEDASKVVSDRVGFAGNPYLRIEMKNGDAVSIIFQCVGISSTMGLLLISKQKNLTKEWMDEINRQIPNNS